MPDRMKIGDEMITIGSQPSEASLHAMAGDGVKTIFNIRADGEDMQPMSIAEEGEVVGKLGMAYESLPVSMKDAGPELVDAFREKLAKVAKPVYVHCKLGQRAGAMVMMDQAVQAGWTGQATLDQAAKMGFACDSKKLAEFVSGYVDSRLTS